MKVMAKAKATTTTMAKAKATRGLVAGTIAVALFGGCDMPNKDIGQPINAGEGGSSGGGGSEGTGGEGTGNVGGGSLDGTGTGGDGGHVLTCEEAHAACLDAGSLPVVCDQYLLECEAVAPCNAAFEACLDQLPDPPPDDNPCWADVQACSDAALGPYTADCCTADDDPGCGRAGLMEIVCAEDPGCCTDAWTDACVRLTAYTSPLVSPIPPSWDAPYTDLCGNEVPFPGVDPVDDDDCCSFHLSGGCEDAAIEACVCAQAPECCTDVWTPTCTILVGTLECAPACPELVEPQCCDVEVQGCFDPVVESCVCAVDDFCCDHWDGQCAAQVEPLGCAVCSG